MNGVQLIVEKIRIWKMLVSASLPLETWPVTNWMQLYILHTHFTWLTCCSGCMQWCSKHVIAPRVYATSAAVKACAEALRVTVQVENVHDGTCESTHYIVRGAPRVTLLRIESHYDIIYPLPPSSINSSNPHEEKLLPIPSSILAYDRRKVRRRLLIILGWSGHSSLLFKSRIYSPFFTIPCIPYLTCLLVWIIKSLYQFSAVTAKSGKMCGFNRFSRKQIFDRKQKHLDRSNQNTRASTSKSPPHEDQKVWLLLTFNNVENGSVWIMKCQDDRSHDIYIFTSFCTASCSEQYFLCAQ